MEHKVIVSKPFGETSKIFSFNNSDKLAAIRCALSFVRAYGLERLERKEEKKLGVPCWCDEKTSVILELAGTPEPAIEPDEPNEPDDEETITE